MRTYRHDLTPFTPAPSQTAFRDALEAAVIAYGRDAADAATLAREVEQATSAARAAGMRRPAFDAAILDFVAAHGRTGLYPLPETTLANVLLAASRGFRG